MIPRCSSNCSCRNACNARGSRGPRSADHADQRRSRRHHRSHEAEAPGGSEAILRRFYVRQLRSGPTAALRYSRDSMPVDEDAVEAESGELVTRHQRHGRAKLPESLRVPARREARPCCSLGNRASVKSASNWVSGEFQDPISIRHKYACKALQSGMHQVRQQGPHRHCPAGSRHEWDHRFARGHRDLGSGRKGLAGLGIARLMSLPASWPITCHCTGWSHLRAFRSAYYPQHHVCLDDDGGEVGPAARGPDGQQGAGIAGHPHR